MAQLALQYRALNHCATREGQFFVFFTCYFLHYYPRSVGTPGHPPVITYYIVLYKFSGIDFLIIIFNYVNDQKNV